ncbi:MAG: D-tyrosyl-tRNA(Tyr) deacylase [Armatimonadetes bacterium]|nr:D-tyrosyl-tRNA(Tyr) deacylase [Armatimonadota bacterium]
MRAVVQRVLSAKVTVDEEIVGKIQHGLLVLLGVHDSDGPADVEYISDKIRNLRIFEDSEGKMNLSVKEMRGAVLLVSQFTLYGDARKGRRPSFTAAAAPDKAEALYLGVGEALRNDGLEVRTGRFAAHMKVSLVNDGPVTLILDSSRLL